MAAALPELPRVGAAFERGEISYNKVRALSRIATPATEEMLLSLTVHGTASQPRGSCAASGARIPGGRTRGRAGTTSSGSSTPATTTTATS